MYIKFEFHTVIIHKLIDNQLQNYTFDFKIKEENMAEELENKHFLVNMIFKKWTSWRGRRVIFIKIQKTVCKWAQKQSQSDLFLVGLSLFLTIVYKVKHFEVTSFHIYTYTFLWVVKFVDIYLSCISLSQG